MATITEKLQQLESDRQDLIDNLETQGITGLTGDETFTELVPEVLNIESGADLSDYFTPTISSGTTNVGGFTNMIKNIPSTTTVSGTSLTSAFRGFLGTTISLFDTSNVTNMNNMFTNSSNLTTIPLLNTSSVTDMSSMFNGCTSLTTIPLIDTSSVTSMTNMFRDCTSLTTIPLLDTSSLSGTTAISSMFNGCTSLTTVPILDTSSVTSMSNMFANCPNLTDTSLDNILQMAINSNVTNSSRKNLAFIGFTSTDYPASRIQALPHYEDFTDAGWTIGY